MIDEKVIRRREQRLAWYHRNKEQEQEKIKTWRKKNPIKQLEYRQKCRFEHVIRSETKRNFNRGTECSYCNIKSPKLHFHHWVYKRPVERKHFSVLCNDCHKLIHRGLRTCRIGQI